MRAETPLVSVIIPCYNAARFIHETLDSIMAQDYESVEILIIDDGSTDGTADLIAARADAPRVRLIRSQASGGPSAPRNIGLAHAEGDCLFLFDSDDVMEPGKIRQTVAAHQIAGELGYNPGLYFTDFKRIDLSGNILTPRFLDTYEMFSSTPKKRLGSNIYLIEKGTAYTTLAHENYIGTSSVMLPRRIVDQGLRFDESLKNADDVDMWFRICRDHDIVFIDTVLHSYRRHAENLTRKRDVSVHLNRIASRERQMKTPGLTREARNGLRNHMSANQFGIAYVKQHNGEHIRAIASYAVGLMKYGDYKFARGIAAATIRMLGSFFRSASKTAEKPHQQK